MRQKKLLLSICEFIDTRSMKPIIVFFELKYASFLNFWKNWIFFFFVFYNLIDLFVSNDALTRNIENNV